MLTDLEAAPGRVFREIVENDLLKLFGEPAGIRIARATNFIEKVFGVRVSGSFTDLIELLTGIAHDLAGFGDVVEVGGEFKEGELSSDRLPGYSGVGGHSVFLW